MFAQASFFFRMQQLHGTKMGMTARSDKASSARMPVRRHALTDGEPGRPHAVALAAAAAAAADDDVIKYVGAYIDGAYDKQARCDIAVNY
jgi:hypothetical protein